MVSTNLIRSMQINRQTLSNDEEIEIPHPLVAELFYQAKSLPDREVCGLLGARKNVPSTCYPVKNVSTRPNCRFSMDAKGQIEAMRAMRNKQEDLFAVYHSHPTSEALPSKIDIEEAAYFEVLYLIISLQLEGHPELRGFRLSRPDPFKEVALSF